MWRAVLHQYGKLNRFSPVLPLPMRSDQKIVVCPSGLDSRYACQRGHEEEARDCGRGCGGQTTRLASVTGWDYGRRSPRRRRSPERRGVTSTGCSMCTARRRRVLGPDAQARRGACRRRGRVLDRRNRAELREHGRRGDSGCGGRQRELPVRVAQVRPRGVHGTGGRRGGAAHCPGQVPTAATWRSS